MQKFTPKALSPLALGGAAASVGSRSHQVIPVFSSAPHWQRPGRRAHGALGWQLALVSSDALHDVAHLPAPSLSLSFPICEMRGRFSRAIPWISSWGRRGGGGESPLPPPAASGRRVAARQGLGPAEGAEGSLHSAPRAAAETPAAGPTPGTGLRQPQPGQGAALAVRAWAKGQGQGEG